MDPLLLSVISACTALVASIAGPLVTLAVAKRNFNATVISANRQKWIEATRDTIAELISIFVTAVVVKADWREKWQGGRGVAHDKMMLDKLGRLVLLEWKLRLLLNPTEADHQQLVAAIDVALKRLQADESTEKETQADIEKITLLAQKILKREWQRVKRGV